MCPAHGEGTEARSTFSLVWPGRMVFGAGCLGALGELARDLGRRPFLVTTPELAGLGVAARALGLLESAGLSATLFEGVQPDPTCVEVDAASARAREAQADLVIAIGGGSAIDVAKGVAVGATHHGPIWDYVTYTGAKARPLTQAVLPVIAVPTTAGTGSEVSQGAVLDNPALEMKAALLSPRILPRVALIDPELTHTMPPGTTAMTGLDAMTHGIESFLNVERSHYASELFALEAVRRAAHNLPRALDEPQDTQAREQMCWAAAAGGMAIGLANASVSHAMALPAGARLHLPHGLLLSRLQPVVLERTWQAQPHRCATLAGAVGAARPAMSEEDKAQALAPWLADFVRRIGLAEAWPAPAVEEATLDALADDVFAYMGRPVSQYRPVFTRLEVRDMFEQALTSNR